MLKICSERNTIGQEAESAALNNGVHNRRGACTHPSLSSLREVPKFVGGKRKKTKVMKPDRRSFLPSFLFSQSAPWEKQTLQIALDSNIFPVWGHLDA